MMRHKIKIWLLLAGLMLSASVFAEITVDTDSLQLLFSEQGDLLRAEACFPACSEDGGQSRELSAGRGMLVFGQGGAQGSQLRREHKDAMTILIFHGHDGQLQRRWQIPDQGWLLSVTSTAPETASLASGENFRPTASSGFGYLLEQSRYLIFDGSSVETIGLDADEQLARDSTGWFGFRNRFWAAMVLPASQMSITVTTGEELEDASIEMASTGQGFELSIYLGPIEPKVLSQTAPELESLMYSGLWQALYFLLNAIVMVVPHWGLAVMVLSVVVGILMRPLSKIADRLQDQVHAIDARLAPTLTDIKKNYKGAVQSEKILKMYKDENVHPLYSLKSLMGVFVVIPIFIGAFDMLAENIHLSGQSFLWIADLSHAIQCAVFWRLPEPAAIYHDRLFVHCLKTA